MSFSTAFVVHHARHSCHEHVMVHPVEEFLDVDIHDPFISFLRVLPGLAVWLGGRSARVETRSCGRKLPLKYWR